MYSDETTLRVARIAARMKLATAAARLGISDTMLSAAERKEGALTPGQVEHLAALHGCEPNSLHGRKPLRIVAQPPSMRR